jgi:septal ring factor EnvC (AmiA/AmiB activator)
MNKINLAIRDCEGQIKILQNQRMTIMAQLDVLKEQLDNLERIRDNKSIPHDDQHKPVTLTTSVDQLEMLNTTTSQDSRWTLTTKNEGGDK